MNLDLVSLRTARASDLPLLAALEKRAHINPWSETLIAQSLHGEHRVWVAESQSRIIGYLVVMPVVDQWELLNIAVDPDYQGQGLGSRWMEHLKAAAEKEAIAQIFLEVRESNSSAINLYQKAGFTQVGTRKNYYPVADGREDALVMQMQVR